MDLDDLDQDRLFEAIRRGVADGIFRIATNATARPCADFYDSIQRGVEIAIKEIGHAPAKPGDDD